MFGDIGADDWEKRLGTEIHIDESKFMIAILEVRRDGPSFLRKLPIAEIWSMLTDFITDHYAYLADETLFNRFEGSYATVVSVNTKIRLAAALENSKIFAPNPFITLYPLVPIRVIDDFESDLFFFLKPDSLTDKHIEIYGGAFRIEPSQFPPDKDWQHRRYEPSAWLGIRAPARQAADRLRASILGALALVPRDINRYSCSKRNMFGGWCTFDDGSLSMSITNPTTPALMDDIHLTKVDHSWLSQLSEKLADPSKQTEREIKALEYFYRAWFLDPSDRYPVLYMALESVFGDMARATQAVIDGVRELLGNHVAESRLRELSDLRAAVIHGGAPEIYDSRKYAKYYRKYDDDPIRDLGLVVVECLRRRIFDSAMIEHQDRHAESIAKAIDDGLMPPIKSSSILDR